MKDHLPKLVSGLYYLNLKTESYLSSISINIALHGEPSEPAKFSGAAFNK